MKTFSAKAHGRVNLIGEHTDYNLGFVLPTAIPQSTFVSLSLRDDLWVIAESGSAKDSKFIRKESYQLGNETPKQSWIDYLSGATFLLQKEGHILKGMNVVIHSSVPEGSGLSSSAALEISFLKAIREAFQLQLTDTDLAKIGQKIENEFVGAQVGIMDQMACALATHDHALFLDTQSLTFESIPLPETFFDLLVINSGVTHRNRGGSYNERRSECEAACAHLQINTLREISIKEIHRLNSLPEPLLKRARHVVTENARVIEAVSALQKNDLPRLGKLFHESHLSMRNDYEISIPEIDLLVDLVSKSPGVYGARLTGGGFGGSIVALTEKNKARELSERVLPLYHHLTQETASVLVAGNLDFS